MTKLNIFFQILPKQAARLICLPTRSNKPLQNQWLFSFLLISFYVVLFEVWRVASVDFARLSGVAAFVLICWQLRRKHSAHYFTCNWDLLIHFSIALDILLEALLIREHPRSFYLCAAAFGLVLFPYRFFKLREKHGHSH